MDAELEKTLIARLSEPGEKTMLIAIAGWVHAASGALLSVDVYLAPLTLGACDSMDKTLDQLAERDGVRVGWFDPDEENLDAPAVKLAHQMGAQICAAIIFGRGSHARKEAGSYEAVRSWASDNEALGPFHALYPNQRRVICEPALARALSGWEARALDKLAMASGPRPKSIGL